jgi:SAM-dependent methyltransferase
MCHQSVLRWGQENIKEEDVKGKTVLEAGSLDVNGSWRGLLKAFKPLYYLGIDLQAGLGVDKVMDVCDVGKEMPSQFDLVVSTEMLEHAERWKEAVVAMKQTLKPGGVLMLTTRGPGFGRHDYPGDHWRFTAEIMRLAFADMEIERIDPDPQSSGVFVRVRRPVKDERPLDGLLQWDVQALPIE